MSSSSRIGYPQICVYPLVCLDIDNVSDKAPLPGQGAWKVHNVSALLAPQIPWSEEAEKGSTRHLVPGGGLYQIHCQPLNTHGGKHRSGCAQKDTFFYRFEDIAERSLYGFKPFRVLGSPQSLNEASERGFYSMANTYRLDAGSQIFGDVSAVFSSKLMRKSALVSALDGQDRAIVIAESLARVVAARFESLAVIGGYISPPNRQRIQSSPHRPCVQVPRFECAIGIHFA